MIKLNLWAEEFAKIKNRNYNHLQNLKKKSPEVIQHPLHLIKLPSKYSLLTFIRTMHF